MSAPPPSGPAATATVPTGVPGTGDLRATLERICATAARVTGARHVSLFVAAEDGADGDDAGSRGDAATPVPDGTGRPYVVTHGSPEPRVCGSVLEEPVRLRGELLGTLRLAGKRGPCGRHGGEPFGDDDRSAVRALATEAGVALGNARLYEAARRRERWIDGSVAVTTALLSGADTDDALQVVAEQARELSASAAGIVLLATEAGGGLEVAAVAADRDGPSPPLGVPVPADVPLVVEILAGRPVFLADAATDPRVRSPHARLFGPVMVLPLRDEGRVLGALVTPRPRGGAPFTRAERALALRFAAQAALALKMADAQRDRERLAVFEDRDRIARDLHDLVVQRLFATGMTLEAARRAPVPPEVRDGVGQAVDALDVTIQEIRAAVFALGDAPAEAPAGLRARVLREITTAAVPLGFTPAYRFAGPVDTAVPEPVRAHLVAALREALSNAFRHAGATRIEVVVDAAAPLPDGRPGVRLTVADDGVGIPEGGRRSGLLNLARRAESLGGTCSHGPGLGDGGRETPAGAAPAEGTARGTTVVWHVPR
ncbi:MULTISPECIES: GAF domain-containing protein [unclassified Streptomyces]|uniref:sensor histidine kinase n=1 Tax=unclassified Streptomyces TaxID=2593676 RepID=UPI00381D0144